MRSLYFSSASRKRAFSWAVALSLGASSYGAVGHGFEVLTAGGSVPATGDSGNFLTNAVGRSFAINDPNLATRTTGSATLTPQYVRPTSLSAMGRLQWDTEQVVVGSPSGEKIVLEGRVGSRTASGDQEAIINRVSFSGTAPNPFEGNPQPGATFANQANGQRAITSGQSIGITISYTASTGLVSFGGLSATPITYTATRPFNDIVIRVNTSGSTNGAVDNARETALTNLRLSTNGAPAVNLDRLFNNVTSNSLVAAATTMVGQPAAGQRQFGIWEDVISHTEDFELTGDVRYTWSGVAPGGSQMAFQVKLGEGLSPIPEPSHSALWLSVLACFLIAQRRQHLGSKG